MPVREETYQSNDRSLCFFWAPGRVGLLVDLWVRKRTVQRPAVLSPGRTEFLWSVRNTGEQVPTLRVR